MAYPAGTILTRAEPLEEDEYCINVVKVIGPSPVRGAPTVPEWAGKDGDYYLVEPVGIFGAVQIAPESLLMRDYDAEYPEVDAAELTPTQRETAKRAALETPEQAFARATREAQKEAKTTKATKGAVTA